jgi:YhcH/YjgK/YiaL family protein
MIYDTIEHFRRYLSVHPLFTHVFEFMNSRSIPELENGRIELYRGIYASINTYENKHASEKLVECHRKYIDIQLVVNGKERIGVCHKQECTGVNEYNAETDVEFLQGKLNFLSLTESNFIVLFPQDAHMPGLRINEGIGEAVKKIVFKVPVSSE